MMSARPASERSREMGVMTTPSRDYVTPRILEVQLGGFAGLMLRYLQREEK